MTKKKQNKLTLGKIPQLRCLNRIQMFQIQENSKMGTRTNILRNRLLQTT